MTTSFSYLSGLFSIFLGAVSISGLLNLGKYVYPPTRYVDADLWSEYIRLALSAELLAIIDGKAYQHFGFRCLGEVQLSAHTDSQGIHNLPFGSTSSRFFRRHYFITNEAGRFGAGRNLGLIGQTDLRWKVCDLCLLPFPSICAAKHPHPQTSLCPPQNTFYYCSFQIEALAELILYPLLREQPSSSCARCTSHKAPGPI